MRHDKRKVQKLANDHINELFQLVKVNFPSKESTRYCQLIKQYSMRHKIPLDREISRYICKNCNSYLKEGISSRTRIKPGKKPLRIITCLNCNQIKRIGFSKK